MKRSDSYNTKQKDLIFDAIKSQNGSFTIKDIHDKLKDNVGLTTIYRLVDKLVDENLLDKFISKDNTTYYQYLSKCDHENHFYLKCDNCGEFVHIDCDCITDLTNHIYNKHKFKLKKEHIIINGICDKCIKEGK